MKFLLDHIEEICVAAFLAICIGLFWPPIRYQPGQDIGVPVEQTHHAQVSRKQHAFKRDRGRLSQPFQAI